VTLSTLVLALVGTLAWLHPRLLVGVEQTARPVRPPAPVAIDPSHAGIRCVNRDGAAWSPDSTNFVLASCSGTAAEQNETLAIFDAHTGAVRARTTIQAVDIQRAIPPPYGTSWEHNVIRYGQPFWSADGRRIIITFVAYIPGPQVPPSRDGLVVLDNQLSVLHVFDGLQNLSPTRTSGGNFGPQTVEQWDLSAGTASTLTLPQGLAYAWSAGDTLSASAVVAQTPGAQPPAVSAGPVGTPLGGSSFTAWQKGSVYFVNRTGCSGTPAAPGAAATYYLSNVWTDAAWSPDGRYLVFYLSVGGRLPTPTPTPPTPGPSPSSPSDCSGWGQASAWPQVPIHDAGMRAALALLDETRLPSIDLAWSPDGRRLAVEPSDVGAGGVAAASGTAPALSVYDCASGRVRAQLSRADIVPELGGDEPFSVMAWSPDSSHLLLVPMGRGSLIRVLGSGSLGG
jgi:hypothetical protein